MLALSNSLGVFPPLHLCTSSSMSSCGCWCVLPAAGTAMEAKTGIRSEVGKCIAPVCRHGMGGQLWGVSTDFLNQRSCRSLGWMPSRSPALAGGRVGEGVGRDSGSWHQEGDICRGLWPLHWPLVFFYSKNCWGRGRAGHWGGQLPAACGCCSNLCFSPLSLVTSPHHCFASLGGMKPKQVLQVMPRRPGRLLANPLPLP